MGTLGFVSPRAAQAVCQIGMSDLKEKDYSLEGLRGLAALVVVMDHCVNNFMPNLRQTNLAGWGGEARRIVAWSPLNLIYSGLPAVWIFFLLSGLVLSIKFFRTPSENLIVNGISKRYFRLVIPILVSNIIYVACALISNYHTGLGLFPYDSGMMLLELLYYAPFTHGEFYNSVLWSLSFEMYGSMIIYAVLTLILFTKNPWLALLPALVLTAGSHYLLFIVGCACCYLRQVIRKDDKPINTLGGLPLAELIAAGALLMAYPCPRDGLEVGGLYSYFPSSGDLMRDYTYYTSAGAIVFFCSILFNERTLNFLNNPIGRFLGDISFPIYLIHLPLIYFVRLTFSIHDLDFLEFLALDAVMLPVIIALSYAFSLRVDKPAVGFAGTLGAKMEAWIMTMARSLKETRRGAEKLADRT